MRTTLVLVVHLVAFAALAVLVSAAAAAPGPRRPPASTTHATKPLPASVIVPKTAAMLPGSTYPWAYPVWTRVGGVVLPTLSRTVPVGNTQPPVWIPIGR